MKLNPDCVRDILLTIEDITTYNKPWSFDKESISANRLSAYSSDEILYHIKQCSLSLLVVGYSSFDGGDSGVISDLSPKGHEFIANISNDTTWNNIKDISSKIGSKSLDALMQITSNVITQLIKSHFNLF